MTIFSKPLISYQELFIKLFYNNLQRKQIISTSVIVLIFLLIRLWRIENASISKKDILHHRKKGHIDWFFFKKLFRMSQIIAPSIRSFEDSAEIVIFALVLLSRTVLTLYLADINGKIVKSLVNKSLMAFVTKLFNLVLCAIPASFINSYIEYMKNKITLNVRTKLIRYAMEKYFKNLCFYDLAYLNNNKNIDPVETFTDDIYSWAHSFSDILCNSIKNSFDILFFTIKISYDFGWKGPTAIMLWYLFSGVILRFLSPPLAEMSANVRNLEYEYKDLYTNINENAEQLAFYKNCNQTEKDRLNKAFQNITQLNRKICFQKTILRIFEVLLHKFGSVISAYLLLGLPVFGRWKETYLKSVLYDPSNMLRDLISSSYILINLRKSFNRFLITLRELFNLSGNTNFVLEGLTVMEKFSHEETRIQTFYPKFKIDPHNLPNLEIIEEGDIIMLNNIELISPPPENNVLTNALNIQIKPGMNTMFMGPLGCGKTALFRILAGVWPLKEGKLQRPKLEKIAYASHKTYFPEGNLRDQIIYPDGLKEMKKKETKDEDLQKILEDIGLHYLVDKCGGFDSIDDWNDVLDALEKQALQIARVVYQKPLFVILDECIHFNEGLMYKVLKDREITALTISHKASLFRFHNYLLRFDGEVK